MDRLYPNRINWVNEPSTDTPLNEDNLNLMDEALYNIDGRVIELNTEIEALQNYETRASVAADESENSALVSEGYAVGTQNGTAVSSGTYYQNNASYYASQAATSATNASANATEAHGWADNNGDSGASTYGSTANAYYWCQQAQQAAQSISGALRPMGTVTFANLPSTPDEGDMYNVSDEFTTDSRFKEGSGFVVPAGSNVYYTADGYWDVLAGSPVTGVKGDAESTYRQGNVNIDLEDLGVTATAEELNYSEGLTGNIQDQLDDKLATDGDAKSNTVTFTSNDNASITKNTGFLAFNTLTSGSTLSTLFNLVSKIARNVRWLYASLIGNIMPYTSYSTSTAYSVGDVVTYQNTCYICTTACSAGTWATNSSCFTESTLLAAHNELNANLTNLKLTKSYSKQSGTGTGSAYTFAGTTMYAISKTYTAQVGDLIIAYSDFSNNNPAMAQIVSGAVGASVSGEYGNGTAQYTGTGGVVGYCTSTSVTIRHMWKSQGSNSYGAYIIHTDISY